MTADDTRAALLTLFSMHLPAIDWDPDEHVARIVCSCGKALYVGHLTTLIVDRLGDSTDAEAKLAAARLALAACREVREARDA